MFRYNMCNKKCNIFIRNVAFFYTLILFILKSFPHQILPSRHLNLIQKAVFDSQFQQFMLN